MYLRIQDFSKILILTTVLLQPPLVWLVALWYFIYFLKIILLVLIFIVDCSRCQRRKVPLCSQVDLARPCSWCFCLSCSPYRWKRKFFFNLYNNLTLLLFINSIIFTYLFICREKVQFQREPDSVSHPTLMYLLFPTNLLAWLLKHWKITAWLLLILLKEFVYMV